MLISHAGAALRRTDRAQADLGHEPAILGDDPSGEAPDRARTPWRWVAGVTLSGFCGLALIGSALYLDLDRQSSFAARPEFVAASQPSEGSEHVGAGKGDRLVRPVDIVAAKQDYQVTQPMKTGDKEILKARPYTLLSTTLTTTPTQFAAAVPPFDPLKTSARAGKGEAQPDALPPQDESEVAFSSHDITPADVAAVTGELSLSQAMAQVDEFVRNEQAGERRFTMAPQMMLMRTSRAGVDPLGALPYAPAGEMTPGAAFPSLAVRMVPENVTSLARTVEGGADVATERLLRPKHGEPFDAVLRENGATPAIAAAISAAFGARNGASPVADGQKVILHYSDAEDPDLGRRIARIDIYSDDQLRAAVAVKDDGEYINVARAPGEVARRASSSGPEGGLSLYQSLYQTALKQGLPKPVIEDFVHAFVNDVDYQRSAQPGDAMTALVADADEYDPHAALLYAALTVRDQTFRYYRFRSPDDNSVDYYDENGRSTRKFLLRKPIEGGVMTSPFGMRYHPILHFSRMHTGVDWGAPVGTPVLAAGNGVIIKAGYDSGYGRRVEIQHANGYVTTYNHMSAFARGVSEGVHVTQGQVIGYTGQSGLATGPHLHYEVIINGNFVDPMGIKLPRTREFDGRMLAQFRKERDRIDGLMSQAPSASAAAPAPTAKVN
jgi:hypothetical protein